MYQLYANIGFLSLVQISYGIWCFQRLNPPHRIYILGAIANLGLWLFSYSWPVLIGGSKQSLYYVTPVLCAIMQAAFYNAALKSYRWSRFLIVLPLLVTGCISIELYWFGQRQMPTDLMSYLNAVICLLGLILQKDLLKATTDLKRNGLVWLNTINLLSALLGISSNLLLNKLYQYQNNEYFTLLYYGFWAAFAVANTLIVTYSIFLDSRKLPTLDRMPSFERE